MVEGGVHVFFLEKGDKTPFPPALFRPKLLVEILDDERMKLSFFKDLEICLYEEDTDPKQITIGPYSRIEIREGKDLRILRMKSRQILPIYKGSFCVVGESEKQIIWAPGNFFRSYLYGLLFSAGQRPGY